MPNVLFILSGSISCYKACGAISQLVQRGSRVRAVVTEAALEFVGISTIEGLTREKVGADLFATGQALEHIDLVRWADVTIVCPATANRLNAMAAGLADDLAGALLLAHDRQKPLLVAPAMNPAMWAHPATVSAVDRLKGWGVRFISPGEGRTACGEFGEGRLAEPDEIVAAIEGALAPPPHRLRVLVTSGGTSEPIDGVRVLTNASTGETGARIAARLARSRHEVLLLRAASAAHAGGGCAEETYRTFGELDAALSRHLGAEEFDVVIHAAAVGDFSVDAIEVAGRAWAAGSGKIPSEAAPTIRLRRNPKLLDGLRARSRNKRVRIVAFKLTRDAGAGETREAVGAIFASGSADLVVHNDLSRREPGGAFPAEIWGPEPGVVARCADRESLAAELERLLDPCCSV